MIVGAAAIAAAVALVCYCCSRRKRGSGSRFARSYARFDVDSRCGGEMWGEKGGGVFFMIWKVKILFLMPWWAMGVVAAVVLCSITTSIRSNAANPVFFFLTHRQREHRPDGDR